MTLKYESEILFDLMKRDGDDAPSDVLPYESELKEKYLNQVVGAYPKLQDYRPEWLNYNLYHHLPSDFPVESVTNVTSASFHDVVPYAYGGAILKGQTLVNLIKGGDVKKEITYSGETKAKYYFNKSMLKANVDYLLIYEVTDFSGDESNISFNENDGYGITQNNFNENGILKTKVNFSDVGAISDFIIFYKITGSSLGGFINNVMLVEYQDGMENWDIPYFEGMQSVQMPVLTTTGKNLFDGQLESGRYAQSAGVPFADNTAVRTVNKIKVKPLTVYTLKTNDGTHLYNTSEYCNGVYIGYKFGTNTLTFTTSPTTNELHLSFRTSNIQLQFQLEEGSTATSYEHYQSNILSTPSDLELRGIGEGSNRVEDELDCLTGKVTERVGEVVLDGSEDWKEFIVKNGITLFHLYTNNYRISNYEINCVTPLKTVEYGNYYPNVWEDSTVSLFNEYHQVGKEGIGIFSNKKSVNEFKSWLSQNPLKMVIILKNPTVKTVDLTCINEQGENETLRPIEGTMHVNTSSQTLPPLLDMSVPVEATTQNLMSFANIEEEEK